MVRHRVTVPSLQADLDYLGGAIAMLLASVNNAILTVGYICANKLQGRTWGSLTTAAFKACACLNVYDYAELLADNAVCQAKRKAFERFHTIVEGLMDPNTQIISDGISLQLRIQKDRSVAAAERLGWKGAPLEVRGVARLCRALDQQLGGAGGGLMAALMAEVKQRRVAVKQANSGVERVYDWAAIGDAIEEAAQRQGVDVRATFAKILASGGDAGGGAAAGDSARSPDMLRKSHLFAQLPAAIAARVVPPDLLAGTTTFCFDFGLCKWIGGGIMLPTDQGVDAERVFQPYTVRGGQYHHDVGVNRARSRRAKGDVTPTLEAKLRRMLECGKQRLFRNVLRDMRRIADAAHPGRDFIVIVGDGGIGMGRGHRRPATKEFLKFCRSLCWSSNSTSTTPASVARGAGPRACSTGTRTSRRARATGASGARSGAHRSTARPVTATGSPTTVTRARASTFSTCSTAWCEAGAGRARSRETMGRSKCPQVWFWTLRVWNGHTRVSSQTLVRARGCCCVCLSVCACVRV